MQKKRDKRVMICAVILGLLPLVSCILRTALDNTALWNYHLAATIGNDEVFYYKYVEGILEYGHPMGFFGFNESRALIGGGPAWSPAISWYWVILGGLMGWSYVMPMLCNLLVMSTSMFLFGILVKPSCKQTAALGILYLCYGQIAYYTLSGVPECIIYSLVILFMAGVLCCHRNDSLRAAALLWGCAFLLTIMRPYYIVLFAVPAYHLWQKNKKAAVISTCLGAAATAGIYAFFTKYMTAAYFGKSVLSMGVDPQDFEGGPVRVLKNLVKVGLAGIRNSFYWIRQTFVDGNFQGRMLLVLFVLFVLVLLMLILHRKEKRTNLLLLYFAGYFVVRYLAVIYLYNKNMPPEAVRHAYDFILIACILLVLLTEKMEKRKLLAIGAVSLVLIGTQFVLPMIHPGTEQNSLDYVTKEEMNQIREAEGSFAGLMEVRGSEISYANNVIWVFADEAEGERTLMEWKNFYGLPAGMALTICYADYVLENFDTLQSAYIATIPNGEVAGRCGQSDANLIYNDGSMVIYQLY